MHIELQLREAHGLGAGDLLHSGEGEGDLCTGSWHSSSEEDEDEEDEDLNKFIVPDRSVRIGI